MVLAVLSTAHAQNPSIGYSLSVTPFHQPTAGIDGGGEFSLSAAIVRFGADRPVSRNATIGVRLKYDADDYDFSGITEFGGRDPWNDVRRFGVGVPVFMRFANDWSFGINPSVDWLQEQDAENSESLAYGATIFGIKSITRGRSLGVGAGVFRNVEGDLDVFPFLAVNWRFNEKLRLSNPFEADVLGPAGLELTYSLNSRWYFSGGGVYRAFRFRLDDEGVAPNGIGENKGFVGFLHLGREGNGGLDIDFYAGATFDGELELLDASGDKIAESGYETAPFIAVSLSADF